MLASPNGVEMATFTSSASNRDKAWPDIQLQFRGILGDVTYGQTWGFSNQVSSIIAFFFFFFFLKCNKQVYVCTKQKKGCKMKKKNMMNRCVSVQILMKSY